MYNYVIDFSRALCVCVCVCVFNVFHTSVQLKVLCVVKSAPYIPIIYFSIVHPVQYFDVKTFCNYNNSKYMTNYKVRTLRLKALKSFNTEEDITLSYIVYLCIIKIL